MNAHVRETALSALGLGHICTCEVCRAGGSCTEAPYAGKIEDLIGVLPWKNIAIALGALGVKVTKATEEAEPEPEPRPIVTDMRRRPELADLRELARELARETGASRHQLRRFEAKISDAQAAAGIDPFDREGEVSKKAAGLFLEHIRAELAALTKRVLTGAAKRRYPPHVQRVETEARTGPQVLARIKPVKQLPREIEPGLYEIPGYAAA